MARRARVQEPRHAHMTPQVLVVALLDAQVARARLPIYNFPPWKRAAAVAKEANDEEHGSTV